MDRILYLKTPHYKSLHVYLSSILMEIEKKVSYYLKANNLQDFLFKKELVYAKDKPVFFYKISYDFFEEAENIGDKEFQVSFVIVLTFHSDNFSFDINADMSSVYEMNSLGWYKKIDELPLDAKIYFDNSPHEFVNLLSNFFDKELLLYKD